MCPSCQIDGEFVRVGTPEASFRGIVDAKRSAARPLARALLTARPAPVPPRLLLRLSALATPLVLHAVFTLGAYGDWIDRVAPGSHALRVALALLPLYAVELPRLAASSYGISS